MPDGSGLKGSLVRHARQPVEHDPEMIESLGIDSPEGIYFLKQYLDAGFPAPKERCKRVGYDYSKSGYFIK
jgi:asparagine synthase (glutamine-hydrolysing)